MSAVGYTEPLELQMRLNRESLIIDVCVVYETGMKRRVGVIEMSKRRVFRRGSDLMARVYESVREMKWERDGGGD
nr:hypothetical protein [Tanacetum cinerariifolium]